MSRLGQYRLFDPKSLRLLNLDEWPLWESKNPSHISPILKDLQPAQTVGALPLSEFMRGNETRRGNLRGLLRKPRFARQDETGQPKTDQAEQCSAGVSQDIHRVGMAARDELLTPFVEHCV